MLAAWCVSCCCAGPGTAADDFARDAAHVAKDLKALKALLERAQAEGLESGVLG